MQKHKRWRTFSVNYKMRLTSVVLFLILGQNLFGQISPTGLLKNKNFKWLADSSSQDLTIYCQVDSWTARNLETVRERVISHFNSVKSFVDIKSYSTRIHLFIVDSRVQMKLLVGHETNGSAFYSTNTVTGIASEKSNSIYSNHEMFHVVAMNVWGVPDIWLNEGMAVYSDNKWHGHDLYQLSKYLADNNRLVPLNRLLKHFRKVDDLISYPLTGSFVKYLDETYGRNTVIMIWKNKTKSLKKLTGKTIDELETDWLTKIKTINYSEIEY